MLRSPALLLFISAIGEIASAYVTIAVSNRVKHMCNGNLPYITRQGAKYTDREDL